jgi:menaquinol-cytochrome c reductase iron-sulfur subunit
VSESQDPSRRDFIKVTTALVGGFIGAVIALPSIAYFLSPTLSKGDAEAVVALGDLSKYPIGIPTLFQFTRTKVNGWERAGMSYGVFVVRLDDTNVRVFSNICTHLGCHVNWHPDVQHYISPCHDGHFDILGKNISGPPPRPLDEFKTRVEAGKLFIQMPPFQRTA